MNFHQISQVRLTPDVVDGIVFWTKNPLPMLDRLGELKDYMYCFQFTLTPYGRDVEPNLPSKSDEALAIFKRLSDKIGTDRVIWRYDPILISRRYPPEYHVRAFGTIAEALHGYTRKVTISFIDEDYRGVKSKINELALVDFTAAARMDLSSSLAGIAHNYGLAIDTCAEKMDLHQFGIGHARRIDDRLFEKLLGCRLLLDKDKTQHPECGCAASVDIGMYNTCLSGCRYCYANYNSKTVEENYAKHDPLSPLISDEAHSDDKINIREAKSCRVSQTRFPGL